MDLILKIYCSDYLIEERWIVEWYCMFVASDDIRKLIELGFFVGWNKRFLFLCYLFVIWFIDSNNIYLVKIDYECHVFKRKKIFRHNWMLFIKIVCVIMSIFEWKKIKIIRLCQSMPKYVQICNETHDMCNIINV